MILFSMKPILHINYLLTFLHLIFDQIIMMKHNHSSLDLFQLPSALAHINWDHPKIPSSQPTNSHNPSSQTFTEPPNTPTAPSLDCSALHLRDPAPSCIGPLFSFQLAQAVGTGQLDSIYSRPIFPYWELCLKWLLFDLKLYT